MSFFTKMCRRIRGAVVPAALITVVVCGGVTVQPKPAEAIVVTVVGGIGTIQDTISASMNTITSGIQQLLQIKEFTLDQIAFSIAKKVLAQTTHDLIDWINTGFEGEPAFIANLDKYLLNAADEVAGGFLQESNFAFVCQPMQMPLRIILRNHYIRSRDWKSQSECTLSESVENIRDFYDGNFTGDGWKQWFEIVSEPQNNIYGLAAIGIGRMNAVAETASENARTEAIYNNGFKSVKDCSTGTCVVTTPGDVISQYLNFKLTTGDRALIEADEINELVDALYTQLGNQAVMGVGGLLGMSYGSGDGAASWNDNFQTEIEGMGTTTGSSIFMDNAIVATEQYLAIYEKGLEDLDELNSTLTTCTGARVDDVQDELDTLIEKYDEEVTEATTISEVLALLKESFDTPSSPQEKVDAMNLYMEQQQQGLFYNLSEVEIQKQEIATEFVDIKAKVDSLSCT